MTQCFSTSQDIQATQCEPPNAHWDQYNSYQKQSDLIKHYYDTVNHCVASAIAKEVPGELDRGLDIACGHGETTRVLSRFVRHVVGVDSSPELIEEAENQTLGERFEFVERRFEDFQSDAHSFDLIGATWYLNHLHTHDELQCALEKMFELLTDDGIVALTVPSAAYTSPEVQAIARQEYQWSMAWTDRRSDRTTGLFSYGGKWIETTIWQPLTLMRMMDRYFEVEALDVKGLLTRQRRLPDWQTEPSFEVLVGRRRSQELSS